MAEPPKVPSWRPGWHEAGAIVRYGGRRWLCLKRTAGMPTDRATGWWRPLD